VQTWAICRTPVTDILMPPYPIVVALLFNVDRCRICTGTRLGQHHYLPCGVVGRPRLELRQKTPWQAKFVFGRRRRCGYGVGA